jgi:hypothetical protein
MNALREKILREVLPSSDNYYFRLNCTNIYTFHTANHSDDFAFGMEIEIATGRHEDTSKFAPRAVGKVPNYQVGTDGTAGANSLEARFLPFNYSEKEEFRESVLEFFSRVESRVLINDNCHYQCGIHIHVGNECFIDDDHRVRFINFHGNNAGFIRAISGRKKLYSSEIVATTRHGFKTVEARCFKSSKDINTIMFYVDFLKAVWEYTKYAENLGVSSSFLSWVERTDPPLMLAIADRVRKFNRMIEKGWVRYAV